jgi:hypothetical protein
MAGRCYPIQYSLDRKYSEQKQIIEIRRCEGRDTCCDDSDDIPRGDPLFSFQGQ